MKVGIVIHDLSNLDCDALTKFFSKLLDKLELDSSSQLFIILTDNFRLSSDMDTTLGKLYSSSRDFLLSKGLYMMSIEILLEQFSVNDLQLDWLFAPEEKLAERYTHKNLQVFMQPNLPSSHAKIDTGFSDFEKYQVSALGGTFDHIHDGHKILLTVAAFLTSSRLIVGITDQELLLKKKFRDYLESFDERCMNVTRFLALLKPALKVEIVPIKDVCGPTGTVPEIECLIVSRETVEGGHAVNKTRLKKKLPKLDIAVVNVLGGKEEDGWKEKLSSTELRRRAMETDKKR
ncbi:related to Phosphopantetheine adenylyltransferase [Zygosaccharomyces bailii]|nr:related to Phosphopantetheine adenylyltransferase [Zygosaccharomyces bailii]